MNTVLSIDLGGTNIKIGIINIEMSEVKKLKGSEPQIIDMKDTITRRFDGPDQVLSDILSISRELINKSTIKPSTVGVSLPGIVDSKTKTLITAPLLKGFKNVPIGQILTEALELPVNIENDANLGALAEATWGNSKEFRNSVYLTISTGFGMGIIVNNKILKGEHNIAGEPCHVPIWDDDNRCEENHSGCLEAYVTGTAISRRGSKIFNRNLTTEDVFKLSTEGVKAAKSIILESINALSVFINLIQTIIDPGIIILGGGVVNNQSVFFDMIFEKCNQNNEKYPDIPIDLSISRFKHYASLMGAAALCL